MDGDNIRMYLDDYAMESLVEMRMDQPSKDRLHYFDTVMEGSVESNALLLQKLYMDIISHNSIDYGNIPESQGALIKYKDYKIMSEAIDALNRLFAGVKCDEVDMMNQLHDLIIAQRKDFEFGYHFDIEIVKISYCVSVLTLCQMINICILAYTKQLRKNGAIEFSFNKVKKKDVIVLRGAKALIASFTSGEWGRMINQMKKDPTMMKVPQVVETPSPANEADGYLDMAESIGKAISAKISGLSISSRLGAFGKTAAIAAGVVATFLALRQLVYFFFKGSDRLKKWLENQRDFVDTVAKQEKESGAAEITIKKHEKLASRLGHLADWIEIHILKSNSDAKKALSESNRENFSKNDFKSSVGFGSGSNIEF